MAYIALIKTTDRKVVGQVRTVKANGSEVTLYETPEYLTSQMATADAKCWKVFHMNENVQPKSDVKSTSEREYTIDVEDTVYYRGCKMDGQKAAQFVSSILGDHPEATIRVQPMKNLNDGSFHLHLGYGSTPTRKFSVYKNI